MQFRGREAEHKEIGYAIIRRIKEELSDVGKIEMDARAEGNSVIMIMCPAKSA